jgi:hypothetical protein
VILRPRLASIANAAADTVSRTKIAVVSVAKLLRSIPNRNGRVRRAANMSNIIQGRGATAAITFSCTTSHAFAAADRRKNPIETAITVRPTMIT